MSNKNETIYSNEILKKGVIYKCYSKTDDKIWIYKKFTTTDELALY